MEILYSRTAIKSIEVLDPMIKKRVKAAIELLPSGDVKKLQGEKNRYRLRVGTYRVLYYMDADVIKIDKVLPRGEVYKRL